MNNEHEILDLLKKFINENQKNNNKFFIVICGPTASGKTNLSLKIATQFNGEIISADSAQVYKKMNVGTAKVTTEEQALVKHHLIDCVEPDESFNVSIFQKQAIKIIDKLLHEKKVPIVCGGTGLYIDSIVKNYNMQTAPPMPTLREQLENEALIYGKEFVHDKLKKIDPKKAKSIHYNNLRYVIRAIEVFEHTKNTNASKTNDQQYKTFKIGLNWNRQELYCRINARIDIQIQNGLLHELNELLKEYSPTLQSMQAIGYKELLPHILEKKPLQECLDELGKNTRNYAKRQITWFKKDPEIHWINC